MEKIMTESLVSVIVPVYNTDCRYLDRCISSVLNQTYRNIELILSDDGSDEKTAKILDEYGAQDDRIRVLHHKNKGVGGARNDGLAVAGGGYIVFEDSDNWLDKDCIEYMLTLKQETNSDIVQVSRYINTDTKQTSLNIKNEVLSGDKMYDSFLSPLLGISWAVVGKLYPAAMIKDYKFDERVRVWEDYIFNRTLLFDYPECVICVSDKPKHHYYMREDSIMHSAIRPVHMKSYDVFKSDVPKVILENKEYRSCMNIFWLGELLNISYRLQRLV